MICKDCGGPDVERGECWCRKNSIGAANMIEVKLTFKIPRALRNRLRTARMVVDHVLTLLGVTTWRWEFSDGAMREVIWGPYSQRFAEVFEVPVSEKRDAS